MKKYKGHGGKAPHIPDPTYGDVLWENFTDGF
jgi:hypothetical protein